MAARRVDGAILLSIEVGGRNTLLVSFKESFVAGPRDARRRRRGLESLLSCFGRVLVVDMALG